ncbi:MAG: hypothetical protein H7246_05800 [Phycisphaerae bacterium]|nr:hypothetical protein [Saprospiraceae bacterium]
MKITLFALLIFVFSNLSGQATFRHTTSEANVSGSKTIIDHVSVNNKPNAILFIMPKWNDGGDSYACTNYRLNAAVQYNKAQKRWMICNENKSPMAVGVTFNVLVAPIGNPNYFIQSGPPGPWPHLQFIDNALTNGKPKALLLVTQNLGTDVAPAAYNDNSQLTSYSNGKWAIANNNYFYPGCPSQSVSMPVGAKFNVMLMENGVVPGFPNGSAYMHETSPANTSYLVQHATFLQGAAVSANSTFIFATPSWGTTQEERPPGYPIAMQYNDSPVAAWFGGTYTQDKWSIVNTNGIPFRRGVLLHVVAIKP